MRLIINGGLAYILFICFIEGRPIDDVQFFLCCVLLKNSLFAFSFYLVSHAHPSKEESWANNFCLMIICNKNAGIHVGLG